MTSLLDYTHTFKMDVRWGDLDALGHVNNTLFFRYIESARIDYLQRALGWTLEIGQELFVLVDTQCTFKRQLHYPSQLTIATRLAHLGNSSIRLEAAIFRDAETDPVATSLSALAWCLLREGRSAPIPAAIRARLVAFEPRFQ